MPPAVVSTKVQAESGKARLSGDDQMTPLAPFTRASVEHTEPMSDTTVGLIAAASQALAPIDVPAFGFLRGVYVLVEATGGTGAVAVAKEDAPWSYLNSVQLADVNGAPLVGPIDGFDLQMINLVGGYQRVDPVTSPAFGAVAATGNFSFLLYVPVEIGARDAIGALPNQNSAQTLKLSLTVGGLANVYSTNPTTAPSVRVRCWADCWAVPESVDLLGNPQAQMPPASGTTQFWTKTVAPIVSGANTVRLPRVGNLIRSLVFIFRTTTPARSTTNFADPLVINWDGRNLINEGRLITQCKAYQKAPAALQSTGADASTTGSRTGVFVVPFNYDLDGKYGNEMRDLWLPTNQGTRLELQGNFGAAGTLAILTNDVAPYGDIHIS